MRRRAEADKPATGSARAPTSPTPVRTRPGHLPMTIGAEQRTDRRPWRLGIRSVDEGVAISLGWYVSEAGHPLGGGLAMGADTIQLEDEEIRTIWPGIRAQGGATVNDANSSDSGSDSGDDSDSTDSGSDSDTSDSGDDSDSTTAEQRTVGLLAGGG